MHYAAFIRNVMIGRKGLTQDLLLSTFRDCGATDAVSVLATGNVVFSLDTGSAVSIVAQVSTILNALIGLREPVFVRSLPELQAIQNRNIFAHAPTDDIYERCITFLPDAPLHLPPLPIRSKRGDVEIFALTAREAYSVTRKVNGKPGYAGALLEKSADILVTTRNWNTVERILRIYA